MAIVRFGLWRPFFLLGGVLILIGGPRHPGGTMAEMLAHPDWVPSHSLITAGFVAILCGLVAYRRAAAERTELPERTARWLRFATWGTALQVIEMVLHTAASVDHANLMAGRATPVLSAHLGLALVAYPIFAATIVGLIVATARDRSLASRWIAWLGIAGAVAHGAAPPLVVGLGLMQFRILFPLVMLLALWFVLAALWPRRVAAPVPAPELAAS